MTVFVKNYVKGCPVCQTTKNQLNEGVAPLEPTEIPTRPWEVITADFVTDLLEIDRKNTLLNVVDKFSKTAIFIPTTKEVIAEETGQLMINYVY